MAVGTGNCNRSVALVDDMLPRITAKRPVRNVDAGKAGTHS